MRLWLLFTTAALGLAACAPSPQSVARARAAHEFQCPESALLAREIAPGTLEVTGCRQAAVYTCPRSGRYDRVCIREAPAPFVTAALPPAP